jgi:DNA-binding beta-propeller fold protein YncE
MRPRAITVSDEEVYVVDTTGRVQVFSFEGEYRRGWSMPSAENGTPTAVHVSPQGTVIIPDTHYSCIREYSRAGELLRSWGSYGTGEDEFIYPTGVALADDGSYYFSEYGMSAERVHVFSAGRSFLRQWGSHGEDRGQLSRAMAIALDREGILHVVDTSNHRVQSFSRDGTLLRIIGSPGTGSGALKFPYDIALAPDGSMLLAEYGLHRISRFDASGKFIAAYGSPGREPGCFNGPRGIAASKSGEIFVADTVNHRVQRFSLDRWRESSVSNAGGSVQVRA